MRASQSSIEKSEKITQKGKDLDVLLCAVLYNGEKECYQVKMGCMLPGFVFLVPVFGWIPSLLIFVILVIVFYNVCD